MTYDRTVRRETAGVEAAAAASVGEALADRGWASSTGTGVKACPYAALNAAPPPLPGVQGRASTACAARR
ncbi:hypothetical protein ACWGH4_33190 [Streptomyces sp. NPDC054847]